MRTYATRIAVVIAAAAMSIAGTVGASAHDVHTFGKVTVALGWLHEPAYVGFDNAVQVLVKDQSGNAITDISDKDLTVEVSLNSVKMAAQPLHATADPDTGLGIPGEYQMHFIPTAPGNYTFHLKGAVTGQQIDESVTASDKTFNTVTQDADVEFPAKVPAVAEVATKIDQVSNRVDTAKQAADRALIVGIAGVVLGLLLGGGGLMVGLRRRAG